MLLLVSELFLFFVGWAIRATAKLYVDKEIVEIKTKQLVFRRKSPSILLYLA